ncbi:MAG TPA: WD40 repeat domain-containing protein [Anaerolineales bacterium]|nr:WD40 repeat domain-containing protein [Anaerolineales bacterium]
MAQSKVRVGNIEQVSGEVSIAGRDIVKGYTPQQVSVLLTQITSTFQPKPFDGHCPYKGLEFFEEEDAELFFGREKAVEDLVNRVQRSRTVFITGPSGCGKSSLVRAGLIHACKVGAVKSLQSERWLYETIKPGREPLETLALVFSRLKSPELADYFRKHVNETSILNACAESVLSGRPEQRFVLYIDQFEEVFTQINKEEERVAFLNVLTDAVAVENGRVILLLAMRSEFISNCAIYPALNALLNQHSAFAQIGAMQPEELVSAIAQPALRVGLRIDPDLIAQIINDMEGEPGALPLMQFALRELFDSQQAKGGLIALVLDDYVGQGGIRKSLERHADNSFAKLSEHERELARSIFSGLIEIGRGTQDTRRTALFDELIPANAKAEDVGAIVQKLADARLIITDEQAGKDTVTISHEKLIDAWPWLKKLVNENRDVIALQNEIAEDATEWDEHQRDASYLYTGARLANAREKLQAKKLVLSGTADAFVQASGARHRFNQIAVITGISTIIVLLAIAVIIFSNQSRAFAQQARFALARVLVGEVARIQNDKRDFALLLGGQAYKLNDTFETRGTLLSTIQCCSDAVISFMSGHTDSVWDVAFSPDSKILASSGNDGLIIIWDVQTHREITRLVNRDSSAIVYTVAFSPTAKILAAGNGTGSIILYDTQTWQPIGSPLRGHDSDVLSLKFSRDGKWLVSGGTDGKVLVWDVARRSVFKTFKGHTSWVWDVDISADNTTVASVGRPNHTGDNTLYLWSLEPGKYGRNIGVPVNTLVSVAFNDKPGSRILVTGDTNGKVIIWDLTQWRRAHLEPVPSTRLPTGSAATGSVWGLAFIPGHDLEIVTGRETGIMNRNLIRLSDDPSQDSLQRQTLGMTGNNIGFFRIAVSPNGKLAAAAGQDGLVSLWQASEVSSVIRHSAPVTNLQILSNGSGVALSVDRAGGLYRWDYQEQKISSKLTLDTSEALQSAISSDGTKVVTGYTEGAIILWDGQTGKKLFEGTNHSAAITSLVFSPDGQQLASSDYKGNVILWKVTADRLEPSDHFTDPQAAAVQTLLFSSDGKTLVGGGCGYPITFPAPECGQGTIYVWQTQPHFELRYKPLPGKAGFVWSMAFNPANPDELAVGTRDGTVTIWNLQDQTTKLSFKLGKSDINALAFSPDGNLLAVGAEAYKIFMYDSRTGQLFGQAFREHDGAVIALLFTPDGRKLLSASSDDTVVIHDMDAANWQQRACRLANRNLTRAEWNQYIGNALPYQPICPEFPFEQEGTATATRQ